VRSACGQMRLSMVVLAVVAAACSRAEAPKPPTAIPTAEEPPALIRPDDSWIEVELSRQMVVLHAGGEIVAEYPAASGVEGYETPPGLYRVQMMQKGPIENVPGVWVADILLFDFGKDIGLHSMPMDAEGNALDATLGQPASGGCVRIGESARVFEFAELGMRVWIH
jgi:lipoprotein-anchoring transpeptidase ErfK/SrfK